MRCDRSRYRNGSWRWKVGVEAGLPDHDSPGWLAVLAPANTDKAVIDKLYTALAEAMNDPKVRTLLIEQGAEPLFSAYNLIRIPRLVTA